MSNQKLKLLHLHTALFFVFILFIIFRSPCSLYLGRSESGLGVFYDYALTNSFLNSLLYVYSEAKYFELWTNLSAIIASNLNSPTFLITVYFALIVKLLLLFYIFFSNSNLLISTMHKFLFASFATYSTSITPEIWLTTLHSKNFFGILSFLMIFQNFNRFSKLKFIFYRFGLIFNGLSSIYSSIFSIIYFYKYIVEKNKINFHNFIFSFIPLITNFFIFLYFSLKASAESDRFIFDFDKIFNIIYSTAIRPIFGGNLSKLFYNNINFLEIKFILLSLCISAALIFFFYLVKKKDILLNIIIVSYFLNIFFILLGSQYADFVGGRYAVISSIIFLTLFLRLIQIEKNLFLNNLFLSLIVISLVVGFIEFRYFNPWMYLLKC